MAELRKLWIPGPVGRLEAYLRVADASRAAAVVAHPHPLHGGTLHNPVVFHADRELHRAGFSTLRFNFRGVGSSDGEHDEGRGEIRDVGAALTWLRGVAPRLPLILVGYSFGAVCGIRRAGRDALVDGVVAIGLPAGIYRLDEDVHALGRPLAVVQGDQDDFGSTEQVRALLATASPAGLLFVVEAAGHLFEGDAGRVATSVVEAAEAVLADAGR